MQMKPIDAIQKRLLEEIADLHSVPSGAYNIRANSELAGRCISRSCSRRAA